MKRFLSNYLDDILVVVGCISVLVGLAQWNAAITWMVGGLMLIAFGIIVGRVRAEQ